MLLCCCWVELDWIGLDWMGGGIVDDDDMYVCICM